MDTETEEQLVNSKSYGLFIQLHNLNEKILSGAKKVKREDLIKANLAHSQSFPKITADIPMSFQLVSRNAQELYESCPHIQEWRNNDGMVSIKSYLLSPNSLQNERFPNSKTNDTKFIDILCAGTTRKILECFSEDQFENQGFHLRGPRGIGKSYLLACYALLLRSEETNRVLYINNPLRCNDRFNTYFANEIVYCFWKDRNDLPVPEYVKDSQGDSPLEKWYKYMTSTRVDPDRIVRCLDEFSRFHQDKYGDERKIIFIIDQMNILYRTGQETLRERVNKVIDSNFCDRRIISASDNNEGYEAEKEKPVKYLHETLTQEESIWLIRCFWNLEKQKIQIPLVVDAQKLTIDVDWKKAHKYSDFRKVLEATGNNPHELAIITNMLEKNFNDIDDLIQFYLEERTAHYYKLHLHYRSKKLDSGERSELYRMVTVLDTSYSSSLVRVYDRNLVFCLEDQSNGTYYSVCPAAAQAIKNYYLSDDKYIRWCLEGNFMDTKNVAILQAILEQTHEFNGSMRGGAFEKLVTLGLIRKSRSVNKNIKLDCYCIFEKETSEGKKKTTTRHLRFMELAFSVGKYVCFDTKKLIQTIELYVNVPETMLQGMLFVPQSARFALIDCIVIQANRKAGNLDRYDLNLYLFQITINVNKHGKGDVDMASPHTCKHEICQAVKSIKGKYAKHHSKYDVQVHFIWFTLGPNKDIESIKLEKLDKNSYIVMIDPEKNPIL